MKLSPRTILLIEEHYGVRYVGYYGLPNDKEMEVFYQENPRTDLGHSNYMGAFGYLVHDEIHLYVTNAKSIAEAEFPAVQLPNGNFIVSRYRHDFVQDESTGIFIDGGLEYVRSNSLPNAYMKVIDGKEVFYVANRNAAARSSQSDSDRQA